MSGVRVADEIRVEVPIAAMSRAIEDLAAHTRWHPFVTDIAGAHELGRVRACPVLVGNEQGQTSERCVQRDDGHRTEHHARARDAPAHPTQVPSDSARDLAGSKESLETTAVASA